MDATEQLEALAALDRGRPARLIALGLEYADARRTDLAVATLGRAAERFPDNVDVYATLGEVWLRIAVDTGDGVALRKALEALRTAVVRGGSSRELALYGRALLVAGDTAAALRSLREAATKLPVAPATLLDLATAAERLGDRQTRARCASTARRAAGRIDAVSLGGQAPGRPVAGAWRHARGRALVAPRRDGHQRRHAAGAVGAGRVARRRLRRSPPDNRPGHRAGASRRGRDAVAEAAGNEELAGCEPTNSHANSKRELPDTDSHAIPFKAAELLGSCELRTGLTRRV